ncbi:MAG: hypothetical protein ACR2NA_04695, partial [Solirubrobacterales bacterium]
MSAEVWTLVFMGLILKLPLAGLIWIVWWAVRSEPEVELPDSDGGGGGFRRLPELGPRPRGPR